MPRHTRFLCRECGHACAKWLGRCPRCGVWDALEEQADSRRPAGRAAEPPLPFLDIPLDETPRRPTGISELDRVLGGGLVPGSAVLLGGEPGIGKSTLLLQAASSLAESGRSVLYASCEESRSQLRLRGERVGVSSRELEVVSGTDVDELVQAARAGRPSAVVVDSIQAVRCAGVESVAGSAVQVRECAVRWVEFAKSGDCAVVLVGHVTKDGSLAGPRTLEHLVDTVLQFEGDRHHAHRILRALKNRFGPADEIGVFRMGPRGLTPVENPSELFLSDAPCRVAGSAVFPTIEGSRPLLVEIQALVGQPGTPSPRRTALGFDANRLAMILAVMQRRGAADFGDRDVFVNVTGGLRLTDPAADLAVAAATASSMGQRPLASRSVTLGEIGLTGEIRGVGHLQARLRESSRLGFETAVIPAGPLEPGAPGLRIRPARDLEQALDYLLPEAATAAAGIRSDSRRPRD